MRTWMKIAAGIAVLALAAAAAAFSVGGGAGDSRGGGGGAVAPAVGNQVAREAFDAPGGAGGAEEQPSAAPKSASRLPTVGPSVIKTADLRVRVPNGDFRQSFQEVVVIAGRYPGGHVLSTSIAGGEARFGTIVIRVPARSFERALTDLEGLGEVRSENVTGQDVTQEFVDLEARLRNSRAQEAVLLRLMDKASTVTDTIRVQGELQTVQLEIERLTGQLRYLEDQTSLGTLTVSLVEAGAASKPAGTLQRAWKQALENALGMVAAVIVGAGVVIPAALLVLVALLIVRQLRPRFTS